MYRYIMIFDTSFWGLKILMPWLFARKKRESFWPLALHRKERLILFKLQIVGSTFALHSIGLILLFKLLVYWDHFMGLVKMGSGQNNSTQWLGGKKISEPKTEWTSKLDWRCIECYQIDRKSSQLCYSLLKIENK